MKKTILILLLMILFFLPVIASASDTDQENWWSNYPWRMVQTNLREIDMEDIDAVKFAEDLEEFGATAVYLNAGGIVAYYDTDVPFQPESDHLHGDSLGEIIKELKKRGIRVVARADFSKIRYEVYEEHPDWAYETREGEIVNYNGHVHTCPTSPYQREYMYEIIREFLSEYDFDGLFLNMGGFHVVDYSGKYYGPCHCADCQREFKERYGHDELPEHSDISDPVYKDYIKFQEEIMSEQHEKIYRVVKGISPEIAIEGIDYTRSESNSDITRPPFVYSGSSVSQLLSEPSGVAPADNASVAFMAFQYREVSVSPALMELRQWQSLANSGDLSFYILGRLDNQADTTSFDVTRKVFQFHKEHEKLYSNLVPKSKVLLMRKMYWKRKDPEVYGWIRALTESHIPFDQMLMSRLKNIEQLAGKEVIVLADMRFLSDQQAEVLDEFTANGGTIIATGETGLYNGQYEKRDGMALDSLGVKDVKNIKRDLVSSIFLIPEEERDIFSRSKETPNIAPGSTLVQVEAKEKVKEYLNYIPEHPFGPPEIAHYTEVTEEPGILELNYQKGKGIYIPWKIGTFYSEHGYLNTLNLMQDILFSLAEREEIAPDLTPMVEIARSESKGNEIIHLINTSGAFANSYFSPLPVRNISLKLKDIKEVNTIKTLRGGEVEYQYQDGVLTINLDVLNDYEALIIS